MDAAEFLFIRKFVLKMKQEELSPLIDRSTVMISSYENGRPIPPEIQDRMRELSNRYQSNGSD
jgi:DNA-binding transcriptional regulator YiaG